MEILGSSTCHQYVVKKQYENADLLEFNLTSEQRSKLKVSDFEFIYIQKSDKKRLEQLKKFIIKYEYLGNLPQRYTHCFALFLDEKIVAGIVMGTPYSFSNILGKSNYHLEKVIMRGASCSICPKNTGSWLISKSINWMVKNTEFRVFSGYSDPRANEKGKIYQALNAILLSKKAGTRYEYAKVSNPQKWFSDRHFRKLGAYKRYAKNAGITWNTHWNTNFKINWDKIPKVTAEVLRFMSKEDQKSSLKRKVPQKYKYILIKGKDRRETKQLLNLFKEHNPKLIQNNGKLGLAYPSESENSINQ